METGRKDIICPLPGGMRRKRAAELFGAGAGLRRLSDREKTLLIDRLRPAWLDDMLARPARPGGRGVHRFRGRVRVPKGQGHAPNPRLGEGAPQPHAITCTVQAGENHTIITIDSTTRPPENAADAEDLIQPFHRGDDTRMANRPGHGLGLSIAKACTDAMQATLAVSRPSPGTFRAEIKLPNRPTQRHCPQQKEHGHRPHARQ